MIKIRGKVTENLEVNHRLDLVLLCLLGSSLVCLIFNFLVFHNSFYSNNLKLNPLGLNLTLILDLITTVIPVYVFSFSRSCLLADFIIREPEGLHQMTDSFQFSPRLKVLWKKYGLCNHQL